MKGKNAIVTGGAGGVGSVIVRRFVDEGVNVLATVARESDSFAHGAVSVRADVTNEKDVVDLFARARKELGSVDIVVNTVGGYLEQKPIAEVSLREWESMMEKNLTSAFLCTREAIRAMKGQDYGRIVNFSARIGLRPTAGRAPYAVSKAGVSLLTEIAAQELQGSAITVNAIAPGIIATLANKKSMPDADTTSWASPESIADLIWWLCSKHGSSVSGTTLRT
jgi:NAD(P)-dependent dehydrogenase (short-subunit alcohol dehydrogenase family)